MNRMQETSSPSAVPAENSGPSERPSSTSNFVSTWNPFTGSMNAYGVIVSSSKPLQYNEDLCAVSFIHRKSNTYSMSPQQTVAGAVSGGIVAMISKNAGATWDSTLLWNNSTQWARYPQGAIYNPPGNSNIDSAFIVATGPVTSNSSIWTGNFFASKKLGSVNYNNMASTVPGAQQFIPNAGAFGGLGKVDFARYEMQATDDGFMHGIGYLVNDINATATGYRGATVVKGTFVPATNTFSWRGDSIIPSVTTSGTKNIIGIPYMAWNEAGTVGYVFHIGCRTSPTASANSGYQPIVFKTIDAGATWVPINGIDFTAPNMVGPVFDRLLSVRSNSNLVIPFFNFTEGISAVVDQNNNLHIVSTLMGASSSHPDSLGYTYRFSNSVDGETGYKYAHAPNLRPYIYDFVGGANPTAPWNVTIVDTLDTEVPGAAAANAGYASNPWVADGTGAKVVSDSRIQASRTPDGKYIVYTYAESDTAVTIVKWNILPNIKAKLMTVSTGSIHPLEINVTRPVVPAQRNVLVASRAFFHYASPKCALAQTITVGANGPAISLPMTVSNNSNLDGTAPVAHRFSFAALNFGGVPEADIVQPCAVATGTINGLAENKTGILNIFIFPNPTSTNATLAIDLKTSSTVNISVMNMMGQIVKTSSAAGIIGENKLNIDLSGLSKGVYTTTIKVNGISDTKKLIIE